MDETAWLIEFTGQGGPCYYGGDDEEGLGQTNDHARAVRFARAEDAQAVIDDIGWTEAKPVEHMWTGARVSRAPIDAVAVKPLDWKFDSSDKYVGKTLVAESLLGDYLAQRNAAYFDNELLASTDDLDDAKAVAQAHYEAAVRSALAHPLPQGEAERIPVCPKCGKISRVTKAPDGGWLHSYCDGPAQGEAEPALQAMERAYGILWRDHSSSEKAIDARKELLAALPKEARQRGIVYAIERYGPTTEKEILEAGI